MKKGLRLGMGGPTANRHNVFTLGTAAVATCARRAVKEKDSGRPLEPIAEEMNEMAKKYYDTSRPAYCAQHGLVDEIVSLNELRRYLKAFAGCAYQNPRSICPQHHMMLPRIIKG